MGFNLQKRKSLRVRPIGFYFSIITAVLSVILSVLILQSDPTLLAYYFISASLMTATVFAARYRLYVRTSTQSDEKLQSGKSSWKALALLFFALIAILVGPLFLAGILDPAAWFVLMLALTSGMSIADIALHFYLR